MTVALPPPPQLLCPHSVALPLAQLLCPPLDVVQKVSVEELVQDIRFVQMVMNDKTVTGPQAANIATTTGGRMPGSVEEWVARRAANIVLHASTKYYDHDWCKLRAWGREFVAKNPGSHFHLEVDNQNR